MSEVIELVDWRLLSRGDQEPKVETVDGILLDGTEGAEVEG